MLHRYLAWGAVGSKRKSKMGAASKKLWTIDGGGPKNNEKTTSSTGDRNEKPHVADEERLPRFLKHLGQEAPELAEFWRFLGAKDERKQAYKFPLHLKDVIGALNWRRVLELPLPKELYEYVKETLRWLYDEAKYTEILGRAGRSNAQGKGSGQTRT